MPTDLAEFIRDARVIDTHEHMAKEPVWTSTPRDVLTDLFNNYSPADLLSAGASPDAIARLMDGSDPDTEARWSGVREAWSAIRHTGYGQAVSLLAREIYQIDEIEPDALRRAQPRLDALAQPGAPLHLLRDVAKLDHIQTDDKQIACPTDESGPDFFFYDISWVGFISRGVDWNDVEADTGVAVKDLATLRQAMQAIFDIHAPRAIAVKTQHAYNRTLRWESRSDADAERAFAAIQSGGEVDEAAQLCFGDWCLARGVELAGEHDLPVKIHTGYYAGNGNMVVDRIRAGHLCPLLIAYPDTRFVLMHIAYPYEEEVIALAKHFANAWADLCWAWSINPVASARFVRSFVHAAPANKLFAFGGDTTTPTNAYAYSLQMRRYLAKALEAEVADGEMTERDAIEFAQRVLFDNQANCFDVKGTRAANADQMAGST